MGQTIPVSTLGWFFLTRAANHLGALSASLNWNALNFISFYQLEKSETTAKAIQFKLAPWAHGTRPEETGGANWNFFCFWNFPVFLIFGYNSKEYRFNSWWTWETTLKRVQAYWNNVEPVVSDRILLTIGMSQLRR